VKALHHHSLLGEAVKRMARTEIPDTRKKLRDHELFVLANNRLAKYNCQIGYIDLQRNIGIKFETEEDEIAFVLKWCN
jgi:hypothetical protein